VCNANDCVLLICQAKIPPSITPPTFSRKHPASTRQWSGRTPLHGDTITSRTRRSLSLAASTRAIIVKLKPPRWLTDHWMAQHQVSLSSRRRLKSASTNRLTVGTQALPVYGVNAWNMLPSDITSAPSSLSSVGVSGLSCFVVHIRTYSFWHFTDVVIEILLRLTPIINPSTMMMMMMMTRRRSCLSEMLPEHILGLQQVYM